MLVLKNNSLSLETYLVFDFALLARLAHKSSKHLCWTFNHQNIIEISQGQISLSISPFLVIYANTSKNNKKKCNINANEDQILFTKDLIYLDHSLPPLGLFLQIKFFFPISKSNTLVWAN
jgi:hypothetical protein